MGKYSNRVDKHTGTVVHCIQPSNEEKEFYKKIGEKEMESNNIKDRVIFLEGQMDALINITANLIKIVCDTDAKKEDMGELLNTLQKFYSNYAKGK